MANPTGVLFTEPQNKPLSTTGLPQGSCFRVFYVTGTTTLATVYQDGYLLVPYSQSPTPITSDSNGRFSPIYLNPAVVYRSQLYSAGSTVGVTTPLEDVDPYVLSPRNIFVALSQAAVSRSSTTTLAIDPNLQIAIPGAGTYAFELLIETETPGSSGATPGFQEEIEFSGTLSAGFATSYAYVGNMDGGTSGEGQVNGATTNFSLTGGSALNFLMARGQFTCTTAGVLSLFWAQETSSANATIINAGSSLTAQQIG